MLVEALLYPQEELNLVKSMLDVLEGINKWCIRKCLEFDFR